MSFKQLEEHIAEYFESVRKFDFESGFNNYVAATIVKGRSNTCLIFENINRDSILYRPPQEILNRCFFIDLDKPRRPNNLEPLSFLDNEKLNSIICQIPEGVGLGNRSIFQTNILPEAFHNFLSIISLQEVLNSFSYFRDKRVSKKVKELLFGIVLSIDRNLVKNNKEPLDVYFPNDINFIHKLSKQKSIKRNKILSVAVVKMEASRITESTFEDIFLPAYKIKIEEIICILKDVVPPLVNDKGGFISNRGNSGSMRLFFDKLNEMGIVNIKNVKKTYGKCIAMRFSGLKSSFIDARQSNYSSQTYGEEFDERIKKIIS